MKMKVINGGGLQNQPEFCDTRFSRVGLHQRLTTTCDTSIPPFDAKGALRAIAMLPSRERDFSALINDILKINDTFFYPASLLSMLLVDENGQPTQSLNATIRSGLFRTLDDWDTENKEGIAHYVLHKMPKSTLLLNFSDVTGQFPHSYWEIPRSYFEDDFLELDYDNYHTYIMSLLGKEKPEFFQGSLLHKELPISVEARNKNTAPVCSAVVARLKFDNKLLGLLVIGTPAFQNFSPYGGVLTMMDLKSFMLFVDSISNSLYNILYNPRN
jgi:hypothetical protein